MKISDVIEEYLGSKQSSITHDTFQWYSFHLNLFGKWCEESELHSLAQITPTHITKSLNVHAGRSENTRHGYIQVVKGFLRWCSEDDELGVKEKVVKRITLPKTTQPDIVIFSEVEVRKLFAACEKLPNPHRTRAILHVLLDTGVRVSELVHDTDRPDEDTGLLVENLFLSRGESYIRVMGKGRKTRTISLGDETRLAVQKYLHRERGHSKSPYVFLARGEEPYSVRMVQHLMNKVGEVSGVKGVHAHRFRHTFAINQLLNGTSDIILMNLLGHTTLEATKIYTRSLTSEQAMKAAGSVVDRLKRGKKPNK